MKRTWAVVLSLALLAELLVASAIPAEAAAKKYVTGIKVAKSKVTLEEGKNTKINVTVKVKGSAKKTIKVKSSSSAVKVKAGKVSKKGVTPITITAKKAGKATITVTTVGKNKKNKKLSKTIKVTVKAKKKPKPTATKKPTATNVPTATKRPTATSAPVATATSAPVATATSAPVATATSAPVATATSAPVATATSTPAPTPTSIPVVTNTPTPTPSQVAGNEVKWTVEEEPYEGTFSQVDPVTNETQNFPIQLLRKYVSFDPWPTTNEQVQYVIKNCDDPYVIAALYIVALDNYEYGARGDYSGVTYQMIESLMNGAGAITGSNYVLSSFDKQHINEFGTKKCEVKSGDPVLASSFAARTFLKGATPYNGYTPEGGLEDKTKWKIIIDQYPYCFDQENEVKKFITLCPRRYTENQEYENGPLIPVEHSQVARIGFRWNGSKKVWLPTDYVTINKDPGNTPLVAYNIKASILFSNDYKAPQEDQGW